MSLIISDFSFFLCKNDNPPEKVTPFSQQSPSLKIWSVAQPHLPAERGGGGGAYYGII